MSIIICKHCERSIDTDFNAEHEDECEFSLDVENDELAAASPHLNLAASHGNFFAQHAAVMHEKARRIDELTISTLPKWGRKVYKSKMPQFLRMRLLKMAAKIVRLHIMTNPMAEITEVWARGKKVGEVGTLDTMKKLGL